MKIELTKIWSDQDEPIFKQFKLIAQSENFKTTVTFYGYFDMFESFAHELSDFPFKRKVVVFEAGGKKHTSHIKIKIGLVDSAGHAFITVFTRDASDNYAEFTDDLEIASLVSLSSKLRSSSFKEGGSLIWEQKSS